MGAEIYQKTLSTISLLQFINVSPIEYIKDLIYSNYVGEQNAMLEIIHLMKIREEYN